MNLPEQIRLNGQSYSRESLLKLAASKLGTSTCAEWEREIYRFLQDFFEESLELEQYTSGTTGDPKRMILDRSSMLNSAKKSLEYFNLQKKDRVLLCLPMKYIAGKMMVVRALLGGLDLICIEPSGNPLKGFAEKVSFAAMVPMQVYNALEAGTDLSQIRSLLIGGGEIHPQLRKELQKLDKCMVYESFGMTETYSHFALRKVNPGAGDSNAAQDFVCLPGTSIALDERACLLVGADGITMTKVVTNDLVEITGPDSFRWLGRYDNMINSGGIKIIPESLEAKINAILGFEIVLVGEADQKLGQKLVLYTEVGNSCNSEQMKKLLSPHIRPEEMPGEIRVIEKFYRNESFKIDRKKILP